MQSVSISSFDQKPKRAYKSRVLCTSCMKRRPKTDCSLVRTTLFHDGKVCAPALRMCRVCRKREWRVIQCKKCKLDVCRFKGVDGACVACMPVPEMIRRLKQRGMFSAVQQIARHNRVELDGDGHPPDWFFLHHRLTSMGNVRVRDLVQEAING